ncbi:MAG: DUF3179 domain-containing protein [Bacteroidota bacterium]|nr:DUF3179 domain-containing protein [Bacteroidota bacterium]
MPIPGSQEIESIDFAYFLYSFRWWFRGFFSILILFTFKSAFLSFRWVSLLSLLVLLGVHYVIQFKMSADTMFYQPKILTLKTVGENKVDLDRLVIGIHYKDIAKAYPIQLLGYHHQVMDSIDDKEFMITYCTVCRTGRVFEPIVDGKKETFRLVGMDHYNAMFEDQRTGSWWRQVNGEAVTGKMKGHILPEYPYMQTTLRKWLEWYPTSLIMQPDITFQVEYDSLSLYESGKRKGKLTKRDLQSWKDKSWILGLQVTGIAKAYDWNVLQKDRIIHDKIGEKAIFIVLANDVNSFAAFERNSSDEIFTVRNDTIFQDSFKYNFIGHALDSTTANLKKIQAYQEYWHSWKTFHPSTLH